MTVVKYEDLLKELKHSNCVLQIPEFTQSREINLTLNSHFLSKIKFKSFFCKNEIRIIKFRIISNYNFKVNKLKKVFYRHLRGMNLKLPRLHKITAIL